MPICTVVQLNNCHLNIYLIIINNCHLNIYFIIIIIIIIIISLETTIPKRSIEATDGLEGPLWWWDNGEMRYYYYYYYYSGR